MKIKKIFTIDFLAIALLLLVAIGISKIACKKEEPQPSVPAGMAKVTAPDTTIIDTIIPDPKAHVQSISRINGDGFYDFVMLGSNYKGQTGLSLFMQDMALSRASLMYWLTTFEPLYRIDTTKVRIWYRNVNQNLSCTIFTLNEGVSCNDDKIKKAANDVANTNGHFIVDRIGILGNEQGGGGSDGSIMFFTGLGNHQSGFCPFAQAAFDGIMWHELLHTYYINHIDSVWNKGAGVYTTNGGCEIRNAPIIPFYQALIKQDFSTRTQ